MQVRSLDNSVWSCGALTIGREPVTVPDDFLTANPRRAYKFEIVPEAKPVAKPPPPPEAKPDPKPADKPKADKPAK